LVGYAAGYHIRRDDQHSVMHWPSEHVEEVGTLAPAAPKVRRVSGGPSKVTYGLLGVVAVLIVVVGVLLLGGDLFNQTPQNDLERDHRMLVEALRDNPDNPGVLMTLAEVEYEMGRKRDAMDRAARASEVASATPGINVRYAQLLMLEERFEEAEAAANKEIEIAGTRSGHPYFILAQVLRAQGRLDEAIAQVEIAIRIDYYAADMKILYGDMLVEADRKDEAIDQYNEALRYLPDDPRIVKALESLGVTVAPSDGSNPHAPVGPSEEMTVPVDELIDGLFENQQP